MDGEQDRLESSCDTPLSGKHRNLATGAVVVSELRPPGQHRPAHAKPVIPAQANAIRTKFTGSLEDPLVAPSATEASIEDSMPEGLRSFNLGTIPASVTPPKTWRRAAWFSVTSTIAALIGLLSIATMLMGPSRLYNEITSLPGRPFGVQLPLIPPAAQAQDTHRTTASSTATSSTSASAGASATNTGNGSTTNKQSDSVLQNGKPASVASTSPPVSVVPSIQQAVISPNRLVEQTRRFYQALNGNLTQAYQLTTGLLKAAGQLALGQHYPEATSIALHDITVDASKGITINTVVITKKDGSTVTEQHVLTFSLNDLLPLVSSDNPPS